MHKPVEFEAIIIGGRRVIVSAKTAEKIRIRRNMLAVRDKQISNELRSAHILPTQTVTNGRHASYIAEPFNTNKHKPENMISLSEAKHAGIEREYKQFVLNEARKAKLV